MKNWSSSRGQKQVFPLVHTRKSMVFRGEDLPDDSGTKGNESRFVRCQWCNSINDTEKRPRGNGWSGNIQYQEVGGMDTDWGKGEWGDLRWGGDTTRKNPVVGGAGCWFCGSSNYY